MRPLSSSSSARPEPSVGARLGSRGQRACPGTVRRMDARILLVEDDRDLRTTMAAALAGDGHAIDEAADGTAALERLAQRAYDVVLLDVGLGGPPDGVEVCRRL